jgi:hypothetical protein
MRETKDLKLRNIGFKQKQIFQRQHFTTALSYVVGHGTRGTFFI